MESFSDYFACLILAVTPALTVARVIRRCRVRRQGKSTSTRRTRSVALAVGRGSTSLNKSSVLVASGTSHVSDAVSCPWWPHVEVLSFQGVVVYLYLKVHLQKDWHVCVKFVTGK